MPRYVIVFFIVALPLGFLGLFGLSGFAEEIAGALLILLLLLFIVALVFGVHKAGSRTRKRRDEGRLLQASIPLEPASAGSAVNAAGLPLDIVDDRWRRPPPRAVSLPYPGSRWRILKLLNRALAAGIVLALRHRFHDPFISRLRSSAVAIRVLAHKGQKRAHVERIAERIAQLEGTPSFPLEVLSLHEEPDRVTSSDPIGMLREDLTSERLTIQTHREMIDDIGHRDPTTRCLLEGILLDEEEHARDMTSLLNEWTKKPIRQRGQWGGTAAPPGS